MKSDNNFFNYSRPHDSGFKHVSGFAEYTDDILEPEGTLFGAIGWSKKANAIIKKIDLNILFDGLPFFIFLTLKRSLFFFNDSFIVTMGCNSL